ncbi:MAG: hypothetical protein ACQEXX_20005 [Bacillota bacterium]
MKDVKTPIELDRHRHIIFDMNAFYELEQHFGSFDGMINELNSNPKDAIPLLLWIGLLQDDEKLTNEQVIEMTKNTLHYQLAEKILRAVSLGLPVSDKGPNTNTNTTSKNEEKEWDWSWFYYMGTVLLNMPEAVFWRSTPRKLFSLWETHKKVNGLDQAEKPNKASSQAQAFVDHYL